MLRWFFCFVALDSSLIFSGKLLYSATKYISIIWNWKYRSVYIFQVKFTIEGLYFNMPQKYEAAAQSFNLSLFQSSFG